MVADVPFQLSIYQGKLLRDIRKEIRVRHYDVQIRQMRRVAGWIEATSRRMRHSLITLKFEVIPYPPKRLIRSIGSETIVRSTISVRGFMLVRNVVPSQRGLACSNLHHVNKITR